MQSLELLENGYAFNHDFPLCEKKDLILIHEVYQRIQKLKPVEPTSFFTIIIKYR
jgi:hypothetical protein